MVVDQETGMAEMMPDPTQAAATDNTGFSVIGDSNNQENIMVMKGEDSGGNIMVMLPNGEQGMVVAGEDLQNHGLEGLVQAGDKEQMYVVTSTGLENQSSAANVAKDDLITNGNVGQDFIPNSVVTKGELSQEDQQLFNGFDASVLVTEPQRNNTSSVHNVSLGNESSMIRIVGIQDKAVRPQVSVVKVSLPIKNLYSKKFVYSPSVTPTTPIIATPMIWKRMS